MARDVEVRFLFGSFFCLLLALSVPVVSAARPTGEKPNVLLIVTDDQGWGDLGSHGNRKIDTPVLDTLAKSGMRLEKFYVCPNCAPTRASLLTGRYHYRTGVASVSRGEEVMHAHEVTLAEVFRANGYATGCFGKWHNGSNWPHHPNGQGFDEFVGLCQGHWNHYFDMELERNGKAEPTTGFVTDVLTDRAIGFMKNEIAKERPFFCYVPFNTPHSPFQAPDDLFDKYKARDLDDKTACVYAMTESIDDNVGRLLAALDDAKIGGNTIVWFFSDNGPAIRKNDQPTRFNGNFYGAKGSVHEGGVRVPSFVRWPGVIPGGARFRKLTAHIDVLPTLADLCGLETVNTLPLDGISLGPVLRLGEKPERWPNRLLFTSWTPPGYDTRNASVAVRTDRWLAVRDPRWRRGEPSEKTHGGWELYDLVSDPFQRHDVGADYLFLLGDMRADFSRWMDHTTDSGLGPIPTEIGHREWPVVTLRAQDAVLSAGWEIKRGNNSWLTNWEKRDQEARWPVDVIEAGRYAIEIEYGLREADAPCTMQVEFHAESCQFSVVEAHDPEPFSGFDRVERGEPAMKNWKRIRAGALDLEAGKGEIVVRPVELKGRAIELKSLIINKLDQKSERREKD